MKFINITDKTFEDIFQVSAKFEQWEYVKHQVFDMVYNYVAVINEMYLPIPFLVYEEERVIGYVQVNYYDRDSLCEICKLIVHETEQKKGYGKRILSEVIKWIGIQYGSVVVMAKYKRDNSIADKLFSNAGFRKSISGKEIAATTEVKTVSADALCSDFDEVPYFKVGEFGNKINISGKCPKDIIGNSDEIHFKKISMNDCEKIIEMELYESQEDYVMPFVDSLAESYSDLFEEEITVTYALCNGKEPIGLMEMAYVKGDEFPGLKRELVYELFRILVDKKYQKQGYGTKAVRLFLDYVKKKPLGDADTVVVSVVEGNNEALKLYEKFGFKIIGRDRYNHIAMKCRII